MNISKVNVFSIQVKRSEHTLLVVGARVSFSSFLMTYITRYYRNICKSDKLLTLNIFKALFYDVIFS